MKRKQLMKLPVPPLVNGPEVPDFEKVRYGWDGGEIDRPNYAYTASVDVSTGEQVLIVDLYRPGGEHRWRLFQNRDGWFFRVCADGRVTEAGLDHTFDFTKEWHHQRELYPVGEADAAIWEFIGLPKRENITALEALKIDHRHIKERRLKAKYRKIREADDLAMLEIRALPKNAESWVWNTLMKESRYLFYQYTKRKRTAGRCTHCGKEVELPTPRQGKKTRCPACGSPVTCKAWGPFAKMKWFEDKKDFYYLQKTAKGFCVRAFTARRNFSREGWPQDGVVVRDEIHESERSFFEWSGRRACLALRFVWEEFRQSGELRFCREDWRSDIVGRFYPGSLDQILKKEGDGWYLSYKEIARCCPELKLQQFMDRPREYPFIQNLVRAGLYRMAQDSVNLELPNLLPKGSRDMERLRQGSIRKALGIGKDELPILRKLNPNMACFRFYRELLEQKKRFEPAELGKLFARVSSIPLIKGSLKHATIHTLLRYMESQEKVYHSQGGAPSLLNDWLDYLDNAVLLGMNIRDSSVRFPRHLRHAHDEAYQAVNAAEKYGGTLQIAAIGQMEAELNERFAFETKKLLIRAPRDHKELIEEGEKLHHCVATYAKKIAQGKSIILFIRQKAAPEEPFFTLELDPNTLEVRQCRGLRNCAYGEDVQGFIARWKKEKLTVRARVSA